MSGTLTQEQLRRIEENKRKALERRLQKTSGSVQPSSVIQNRLSNSSDKNVSATTSYQRESSKVVKQNVPLYSTTNKKAATSYTLTNPNVTISLTNQRAATTCTVTNQNVTVSSTKQNMSYVSDKTDQSSYKRNSYSSIQRSGNNQPCSTSDTTNTEVSKPSGSDHSAVDRIEQNRLKALALRAERLNKSPPKSNQVFNTGNNSNTTFKSSVPVISNTSHVQTNSRAFDSNQRTSTSFDRNVNKNQSENSSNFNNLGPAISSRSDKGVEPGISAREQTVPAWNAFGGLIQGNVKGSCVLVSRDRFEVKVGYCAPLIELFKSMETKLYDAVSKRWTFKLSEYNKFISAVKGFKSMVEIEPLPRAILQGFSSQLRGDNPVRDIPMANLSKVDPNLVNSLMSFQRTGVNFGVYKNGRVLIADDMGLGKTIQAICLACYYRSDWPLLVVVPSSVRFDWAQQFRRWVPSIDPDRINVVVTGKDSCTKGLINILSYDLMARRGSELQKQGFKVVIMDESHLLKNYKTARCRAAVPVLQSSKRVILLSGTPALSRPSELYTQISAVCPFMLKFHEFGVRYCDGKQMQWGWDFSGSSNMAELQIFLEETVMIRRLKKEVLSELPDKVRHMVMLDPSSIRINKELKTASKVMANVKLKNTEQRGALLDFFHKSGSAKLKAIKNYVEDLLEQEKKFLIFAHHGDVLDGIEEVVTAKLGKNYIRIDGRTASEQRSIQCGKFQSKDSIRVAILSITAANAGLNLSAANLVVFAELFWNPGILVQAEDRAHRIGQQDSVSVQYLVATGTSDDSIWPMIQRKLDVLGKAGLTKDNFSAAETTRLKDQRQLEIEQFLEESFSEEFQQLAAADEDDIDTQPPKASPSKVAMQQSILKYTSPAKDLPQPPSSTPPKKKESQKPSGLFKYFSPTKSKSDTSCDIKNTSKQTSAIPKVKQDQEKATLKDNNGKTKSRAVYKSETEDLNESLEELEGLLDDSDWFDGEMDIPPVKKRKVEPFKPPFVVKGSR